MSDENLFVRFYDAILENEISLLFSVIVFAVFATAIIQHFRQNKPRAASFTRSAPMALTSIGILGTFVGIFVGLLDFNVRDIDASVPALLAGLKIAFVTSILGMSGAILFKIFQSAFPVAEGPSGVSADEIYEVLTDIRGDAQQFNADGKQALDKIRSSIAGEEDSSLLTQVQKLRTTIIDGNSELKEVTRSGLELLIREFQTFAETMAENNSKALIEALEEVMRDFNAKINEQFGDNFKRLNEAVEALLEWQDKYREHVETLTAQFEIALKGVEATRAALAEIAKNALTIPPTMDALSKLLESLQAQVAELERHLEAFSHLRTQAGEAFPIIEKNLTSLTEDVSKTFKESAASIQETINEQSREIRGTVADMRQGFSQTITESNEVLQNQISELDKSMQEEVKRVVELMGSHLATLSNKFVEDYGPLTDKLRRVVELGRHV